MTSDFNFPWQFNFPPFFTIQPNLETRKIQLETWSTLIIDYCCFKKIASINTNKMINEPIFYNKKIDRQLSRESLLVILDYMQSRGSIEWANKEKTDCFIYWKTAEEWSQIIYGWVKETGQLNSILTFYEILEEDANSGRPFYKMDLKLFIRVLNHLNSQNKAEIIGEPESSDAGVKFY